MCVISTFLEKKVRNSRLKLPFLRDKLATITALFLPNAACKMENEKKNVETAEAYVWDIHKLQLLSIPPTQCLQGPLQQSE